MPHLSKVTAWSAGDVVAGITVSATSLPQYIAYAELAGLSGHRGLQTSGPPIMAFALVTGAPTLCIGVTSITALMANSALNGGEYKEANGEERWVDLLGAFSVLVGLVSLVLAALGASRLASLIPKSVKAGWKLGFAITVVAAQMAGGVFEAGAAAVKRQCELPEGLPRGGTTAMYRLGWILVQPHLWDAGAVALTGLTLFIVLRCGKLLSGLFRLPGIEVLTACALGTGLAVTLGYSGDTVGKPPAAPTNIDYGDLDLVGSLFGWVRSWPWDMPWAELFERLGGPHWAILSAVAFAAVDFLAIISVVPESPPSELAGQGVGCIVSGMVGSAPIGGSLSRSMVAGMTGASSPLMGLVSGIFTLVLGIPQVGALLAPTPKAVLAAVVLAAVLPSIVWPKDVLQFRGLDAIVAWSTALASCFSDPTRGFGVGLLVHILLHFARRTPQKKAEMEREREMINYLILMLELESELQPKPVLEL